ncbi:hypothetical protein C4K04_1582 [Pseudomonas chlororaphis]|uniref:Uncharacterized protein n=1 Tax=Pseudomonas chlororaphis TaxID=587753 RepID=A0A3G7TLN6_9PSED|nr:hypothetical protein [Pseudomonas chlororaphis]AZE47272.1 hypothetical protein C4K04_1582 [Pseudomonas chlororaphis]
MEDTPNTPFPADDLSEDVVTRESLYEQAWSIPMTKIGERYGVSSSYLARVYTSLNIPRPPVGYWAQVAAGKGKARPPLPVAQPGALIAWSRNGAPLKVSDTLPKAPRKLGREAVNINATLPRKHPLLLGIEEHFQKVRKSENGYLRPTKRSMADLIVSRTGLAHVVDFANQLYLTLMKKGFSVALSDSATHMSREPVDHREKASKRYIYPALWQPQRPTVVYMGSVKFGLTIYEISEYVPVKSVGKQYVRLSSLPASQRRSPFPDGWIMSDDMPTGRLCLQVYSPYYRAEWVHRWIEDKPGDLVGKIASIIKLLIAEAPVLANKVEVERERSEREHQKYLLECEERRRQEEEKRRLKVVQDSRDQLESVIQTWAKVNSIRAFFDDIERSAQKLGHDERKVIMERLTKAKELVGDLDALKHFEGWEPPAS